MGDVESVAKYSKRAREIATLTQMPDTLLPLMGMMPGLLGAVVILRRRLGTLEKAIEIWEEFPLVYPFQWIAVAEDWRNMKKQSIAWHCVRKIT